MTIVQNLVPKRYQQELESVFSSAMFPWYYSPATVPLNHDNYQWVVDENTVETSQMVHTFYYNNTRTSDFFNLIQPILLFAEDKFNMDCSRVHRVKANLLTKNPLFVDGKYTTPHTDEYLINKDETSKYKTLLYYVNTSDGETTFFNERFQFYNRPNLTKNKEVIPQAGTAVLFDSNVFHCSKPPVNNPYRIIINIVLEA